MNKRLIAVVTGGALAVGIAAGFAGGLSLAVHADAPRCTDSIADAGGICHGEPLPPCPTEDSDDCYWDAATMGNGSGRSFMVESGVVTYLDSVD
jgi:hypothetical protein